MSTRLPAAPGTVEAKPRRPGRGRAAHLSRVRPVAPRLPYIVRNFAPPRLLDEDGLQLIERNADTILQEVGMDFRGDPEALDILRRAGADVRGENVRFERGMCRKIIQATAPRDFVQHARNPANNIRIGGTCTVFTPAGGAPFVHDIERGRRYGSSEDYLNLLKIAEMLPCIHSASGGICEMVDVPVPLRHLHAVYAQFRNSDRAIKGVVRSPTAAATRSTWPRSFSARNFSTITTFSMPASTPTRR